MAELITAIVSILIGIAVSVDHAMWCDGCRACK